jgi:4'-phosphopantetheinyl transferase
MAHCAPGTFRFTTGNHGKPRLPDYPGRFFFSVSHTRGWGAIALSETGELGVVSNGSIMRPRRGVARGFFTGEECAACKRSRHTRRREAFFTLWTAKEAYLKARGAGLTKPCNRST